MKPGNRGLPRRPTSRDGPSTDSYGRIIPAYSLGGADEIANAMREEIYTDPQERRVRLLNAAPYPKNGRQCLLWDDMRTASNRHMHAAFQNRRQQIVLDCHQLKMDTDSYNQNFNTAKSIQMIFDFTLDLAGLEVMSEITSAA